MIKGIERKDRSYIVRIWKTPANSRSKEDWLVGEYLYAFSDEEAEKTRKYHEDKNPNAKAVTLHYFPSHGMERRVVVNRPRLEPIEGGAA